MKLSELDQLIYQLGVLKQKGQIILTGEVDGMALSAEALASLSVEAIAIKNAAIAVASSLTPDILELELG